MGDIGWGVNEYISDVKTSNMMPKPHVRSFDKKELNNFIDKSGYFANTLDKHLGLGYSDKMSIRDMRSYIFDVMDKVNQHGSFTAYNNSGYRDSYIESRFKVEVQ